MARAANLVTFAALALCAAAVVVNAAAQTKRKSACERADPEPVFTDSTFYQTAHNAGSAAELRRALEYITADGFIDLSYACIWDVLSDADTDPSNSSNVMLLYTDESWPRDQRDTGSSVTGWNREHVWPKSHGFPNEGDLPYCDAHHLRAAEKRVNNKRLDKDFQEGGTAVCLLPWGASISDCDVVNYETSTTFDVPPMHRGDVARMAFYLEVHYGITEYGLELVDRQTYQSSEPNFAYLCTLRSWHEEDPVSAFEKQRNNVIWYWQGNRNPFIDHPEWVGELWSSC